MFGFHRPLVRRWEWLILTQVLRGVATIVGEEERVGGAVVAAALDAASTAAYSAVMRPVEGTILTVVKAAADGAAGADGGPLLAVLDGARDRAATALDN